MSLTYKRTSQFTRTVEVSLTGENADKPIEGSFKAQYEHIAAAEVTRFLDRLRALGATVDDDGNAVQPASLERLLGTQHEFIKRVLKGVEDIGDEDGQKLDADAQLAIVLEDQEMWMPALAKFLETYNGAARKNGGKSQKR